MKFNIVFTTNTVRYLYLFTLSLLKYTGISYRLVANACTAEEIELLETLVGNNSRLELKVFPSDRLEEHHVVLNYLQQRETSKYFCFMDSDILATGDFISEFQPYLTDNLAVFSGRMLWTEEARLFDEDPVIGGRFFETSSGYCLGSSYFAMYENDVLSAFIRKTNIGFERYYWDKIPVSLQNELVKIGLDRRFYDTGKLLNILFHWQGAKVIHRESDLLHHIGGLSWYSTRVKGNEAALSHAKINNPMRLAIATYFSELLDAFVHDGKLPQYPVLNDAAIDRRLHSVTDELLTLYGEAGDVFKSVNS